MKFVNFVFYFGYKKADCNLRGGTFFFFSFARTLNTHIEIQKRLLKLRDGMKFIRFQSSKLPIFRLGKSADFQRLFGWDPDIFGLRCLHGV
ncbi:hypothetical protein V6Z11_A12G034300 [Gossypium hirsutum]